MAGRNCLIHGATRSRRLRLPASMSSRPTCAAMAAPARRRTFRAYSIFDTVGDMVGLVQALGEKKAVIIGHDWGAPVAWHAAMFRPDMFTAVAGLSVPPPFRGRGRPLDMLKANGITNFYWQYFQTPGVAEAEFERDLVRTFRTLLGPRGFSDPAEATFIKPGKGFLGDSKGDGPLPSWLTEADIAVFVEAYKKSGFRGGLELVPQHRSQLGADRAVAGRADPSAVAVHRGLEGRRHQGADRRQARQRARGGAAEFERQADHRRRRPLGAAGAARRGQRGADRFLEECIRRRAPSTARGRSGSRSVRSDRSAHRPGLAGRPRRSGRRSS